MDMVWRRPLFAVGLTVVAATLLLAVSPSVVFAAGSVNLQPVSSLGGPFAKASFLQDLNEPMDNATIPRFSRASLAAADATPEPVSPQAAPPAPFSISTTAPGQSSDKLSTSISTPSIGGTADATPDAVYGISGDTCTVDSSGVYHMCDYQSSAWTDLSSGLDIVDDRIIIPWDTTDTYDATTGQCVLNTDSSGDFNEVDDSGQSIFEDLLRFVSAVETDGMVPVIALSSGNGVGEAGGVAEPYWPNADSAHGWGSTGDYQYGCGFDGIATYLHDFGVNVPFWETFNEPDSGQPPNYSSDVPTNVAANYYTDAYLIDHTLLGYDDDLITGAFNFSSLNSSCCGYVNDFLSDVSGNVSYYDIAAPNYFSGHPYDDPDLSGYEQAVTTPSTTNLVDRVNAYFPGASIWLTEAGVWLNDPTPDGSGTTLSYDVNGDPYAQAWAAVGFKDLANVSSQIKGVNYYEFETYGDGVNEGSDSFDSALLGVDSTPSWDQSGSLVSSGGTAVPRASFCVLAYGDTPLDAVSDSRCDNADDSGVSTGITESVLGWCSATASTPSKSPAGETCSEAGLDTLSVSSCESITFPDVTAGVPWSNWIGDRQYAYEDCNGRWSYAGLG
jgi:hypothetical protein